MKSTGLTRRIDELGRILIPSELRKTLGWRGCDYIEITLNEGYISLTKVLTNEGVIRKLDDLGRVVIPREILRNNNYTRTAFEIFVHEDSVLLKEYAAGCIFCGEASGTINYMGRYVCKECIENLKLK